MTVPSNQYNAYQDPGRPEFWTVPENLTYSPTSGLTGAQRTSLNAGVAAHLQAYDAADDYLDEVRNGIEGSLEVAQRQYDWAQANLFAAEYRYALQAGWIPAYDPNVPNVIPGNPEANQSNEVLNPQQQAVRAYYSQRQQPIPLRPSRAGGNDTSRVRTFPSRGAAEAARQADRRNRQGSGSSDTTAAKHESTRNDKARKR
jgi:hypothetical protein